MPAMPYMLEVGRILSWVTDYVEERDHLIHLFNQLQGNTPLTEIDALNSPRLENQRVPDPVNVGANITPAAHLARDWLGWPGWSSLPPQGPQPPFNPGNRRRTGWWIGWNGNAEEVIRKTLLCASEIALDVPRGGNTPNPKTDRHWHMQFLWVCGSPFLQGWVSWQEWDDSDPEGGNVTVTFTTPGNGHPLYATPRRPPGAPTPDADYENPAQTVGEYGLWLIGENRVDVYRPTRPAFHAVGSGFLPKHGFVHTSGDVIVVAPAEIDGGVLQDGRRWER